MKVGVIGAGPIGQALARLVDEAGNEVLLATTGRPPRRKIPMGDHREVAGFADLLLMAVPAWEVRENLDLLALEARHRVVLFTRGLGAEDGPWLSELVPRRTACLRAGVLAGPFIAQEVLKGIPTALVVSSRFSEVCRLTQDALHGRRCRVYANDDPRSVELAATMVSVLAVAIGVSDAMGMGVGTRGVVVSRGLAEANRLAVALEVDPASLFGLAGIGELVAATSHPKHPSYMTGREILNGIDRKATEPIRAAGAALGAARRLGVELPLAQAIYAIAHGKLAAPDALKLLMERPAQEED
jgi:glycerol-3-phosphate dehydrogenase (NAD(P)+)